MGSKKAESSCKLISNGVRVTRLPQSIVDVWHGLAETENGVSTFAFENNTHLETHGSGGIGACMLRVSLRLVCPFTLIVSYLSMYFGHC